MQLKKLENIDMSGNKIENLVIDFQKFDQLKIMTLVGNPWNREARENLSLQSEKLRERGVIVHLHTFDASAESNNNP
jgi:hypothetical protein